MAINIYTPAKEYASRLAPQDPETADYHNKIIDKIVSACEGCTKHEQHETGKFLDDCNGWVRYPRPANPAGYTYWGQFLAHELSPRSNLEPSRSSLLDLDSVYGEGWFDKRVPKNLNTGELNLGYTRSEGGGVGLRRDLPRTEDGVAIPEIRNDENLLIAQFHVLLIRFHNCIVRLLRERSNDYYHGEVYYSTAKAFTIRLFQKITISDFLTRTIDEAVYNSIFIDGHRYIEWDKDCPIPIEVKNAVLRFGHSQVLDSYFINSNIASRLKLRELFQLTSQGELTERNALPSSCVVNWENFFIPRSSVFNAISLQGNFHIQPTIANDMTRKPEPNVVVKNIKAGIFSQLPSGQNLVRHLLLKIPQLKSLEVMDFTDNLSALPREVKKFLKDAGISKITPLWVFVLLESYLSESGGRRLGPIGSLLLGETIRNSVENYQLANQKLELNDYLDVRIASMFDLIAFVKSHEENRYD